LSNIKLQRILTLRPLYPTLCDVFDAPDNRKGRPWAWSMPVMLSFSVPPSIVAAQFTFGGRTYLAINQDGVFDQFLDTGDLLLDITGATGTIGASNFI
jgi:hypothetical protein